MHQWKLQYNLNFPSDHIIVFFTDEVALMCPDWERIVGSIRGLVTLSEGILPF